MSQKIFRAAILKMKKKTILLKKAAKETHVLQWHNTNTFLFNLENTFFLIPWYTKIILHTYI